MRADAFVCLVALGACGDDSDGGTPSAVESACESYGRAACERLFRCVPNAPERVSFTSGAFSTSEQCASRFAKTYCGRADADVAAGLIAIDPTATGACVDESATSACGSAAAEERRFLEASRFEECDAVSGAVAPGDTCAATWHCEEPSSNCVEGPAVCSAPLSDASFEEECLATAAGAAACDGLLCIGLAQNQQGKTGLCTAACHSQADCGATGVENLYNEGNTKGCFVRI